MCNFRKLKLFQTPLNLFWTCRQRNRRPVRLMRTKIEYLELIRMSLLRKPHAMHSKIEASVFWQSTKFSAPCYTEMVVHTNCTLKRGTLRLDLVNLVSLILTLEHPVMVQHALSLLESRHSSTRNICNYSATLCIMKENPQCSLLA